MASFQRSGRFSDSQLLSADVTAILSVSVFPYRITNLDQCSMVNTSLVMWCSTCQSTRHFGIMFDPDVRGIKKRPTVMLRDIYSWLV